MPTLDRSKLLKFLSEPRYAGEVAGYFKITSKLAMYHLKEAIKSGQVLVSEKRFSESFQNFRGKFKQPDGFLYVYRNSPLLAKGSTQPTMKRDERFASTLTTEFIPAKFISQVNILRKNGLPKQEISAFTDKKAGAMRIDASDLKPKMNLDSKFLNLLVAKGRMVRRNRWKQPMWHARSISQDSYKPLSQIERIHLFQAVSAQPLTFLELHERFGVSKQIIEGFVRRGLFKEVWGLKDIGVKFKLSNKGKMHLRELEAAAKTEPQIMKKAIVHLKHRTPL